MRISPGPPSELPARTFRFELERKIGKGAGGTVFRARDLETGQLVALKVGHSDADRPRLADEAEVLAFADSPTLACVVDAGLVPAGVAQLDPGRPYLALRWVEGNALDIVGLEPERRHDLVLAVARDVGAALAALHATGMAHGDVKPSNIVVEARRSGGPRAVLVDLGLGAPADGDAHGGTLRYLAPECFSHDAIISDGRARDCWALGVVLAELASPAVAAATRPHDTARAGALPSPLAPVIHALLACAPGARPPAEWVCRRARDLLGEAPDVSGRIDERGRALRRSYLVVRRPELLRIARGCTPEIGVQGAPGAWLGSVGTVLSRIGTLRGAAVADRILLSDLDALGRARWVTALVGSAAARWPSLPFESDSALADRLIAVLEHVEPQSITLARLEAPGSGEDTVESVDPVALGVALGGAAPSSAVIEAAEGLVARDAQPVLALALGRALRLRGEFARAMTVLSDLTAPEALLEGAECARRAGDLATVSALLDRAEQRDLSRGLRARASAIRARLSLDRRETDAALRMVELAAPVAPVLEVRALLQLSQGNLDGARVEMERARTAAITEEERARVEAVAGNIAHAAGDSKRALDAFRSATDHAARAGAVLEEASYLTGVAAAGFEAGRLAEALDASTRATLLFEHLGRSGDAARALLARAAVLGAAGAAVLACEAADLAMVRARESGDVSCRAFAHLVRADVAARHDPDGLEHARRAAALLEGAPASDRLRAAARLHVFREALPVGELDRTAEDAATPAPARLEWWGARALSLSLEPLPERADRVLSALGALATAPSPVSTRGEAFAAGAALAARIGQGDTARRFAIISLGSARALHDGAPPELRAGIASLAWASRVRAPREDAVLPEQIADVESLIRVLGTRDRLRPLLDQALDALVLWTGVERGLLLLRAPGGKLAPRAARNIARADLSGTQLALSRSLAERALSSGETVVAVDAAGELPEIHESVHALKLRSVLAVPLLARGEALGVVYLDDRIRRGAFGPAELAWVRLVAALAAVAIADARDQLGLRRAARRARRAEERLAAALARREAELDVTARELMRVRGARATRYAYDEIVGDSAEVKRLLALVDRVTPTEVPVLIAGESGSGKELVARAIHRNGPRAKGPFVSENCGAIPESLLESTLFGHVRGAFTGASRPHAGLFEVASGGTLFLDEIGEMSLGMQTKLLRVLEDGEVRPVGSERTRKVDVRVIAASHRDLAGMATTGAFRRDLFYRLNVVGVDVPPLRARPGDIEPLARHLIDKHGGARKVRLSRAALALLAAYAWPGNVRQLENELRRALVMADDVIAPEHLSAEVREGGKAEASLRDGLNVRKRVDALEAELVRAALERTSGNQTRAAELLGLSRFGLQKMIRRLEIQLVPSEGQA